MAPTLVGLLNCGKMLPPQLNRRCSAYSGNCLVLRGDLLGGSEDLPPLCARPPQLRNSAIHGLRHAAHGVGVLLALLLQPSIRDPLVECFRVHELLVALPHQRVQVVGGVLLPELPQHQLLVARLDALHGSLSYVRTPWCCVRAAPRSGPSATPAAWPSSWPASARTLGPALVLLQGREPRPRDRVCGPCGCSARGHQQQRRPRPSERASFGLPGYTRFGARGILQPRLAVGPQPCVLLSYGRHAGDLGSGGLH